MSDLWIVLSLLPPLLWACSNVIDEYLARRHFAGNGYLYVFMASIVEAVPALAVFCLFPALMLSVPVRDALILMGVGILIASASLPYIYAIQRGGAALVIPMFEAIPVFVLIMAWIFLGEIIPAQKLFACFVIMLAAMGIAWDFSARWPDARLLALMLLSSFMFAACSVVLRWLAVEYHWLAVWGWMMAGSGSTAMFIFSLSPSWRRKAVATIRAASSIVTGGFLAQAALDMGAIFFRVGALAVAPAAGLVQSLGGTQPFYVFFLSLILGILFPHLYPRMHFGPVMVWRLACMLVLLAGVVIIYTG